MFHQAAAGRLGIELSIRQSHQAVCIRRSCPPNEMVGSTLKACREMQYFPPGIGELTRPRSFTQHAGKISIILGTWHGRRLYHRRQNTSRTIGRGLPIRSASAPVPVAPSRQWCRCQPHPQPPAIGSTSGAAPDSRVVGSAANGAACTDAAKATPLANVRINSRISPSLKENPRAIVG